jgi:hypothetical protein
MVRIAGALWALLGLFMLVLGVVLAWHSLARALVREAEAFEAFIAGLIKASSPVFLGACSSM